MLVNESMLAVPGQSLEFSGNRKAWAERISPELPPAERLTPVGKSEAAQVQQ
ncbi:MAG TPA: hypothetical protein VI319_15915 [Burkholderiales bacterium]